MTTQPPSPEAVEAAMKWARDCSVTDKEICILGADDPYSYGTDTAARILAAEVERLRAELDRRHKEYASALNRRVDVENALAMVAAGKRDLLTRDECRELAVKLGVLPATPITNKP